MTVSFRRRDLPFGALVLVTNGTKPIALQVIKQLLERGYRVRTTTGIFANASWLDRLFATYVDSGVFERLTVGDPSHSTAFRKAVRGVDAIVHSATVPLIGPNLDEAERLTAASVFSMLSAAEREPSVRAFVYTSSIVAATPLAPSSDVWVGFDTWNRVDAELASSGGGGDCVYNASLAAAEQVVWLWRADRRPHFRVNVISPANIIGQNFGSEYTSDWKNWIFELYMKHHAKGVPGLGPTQPHWYVDVEDVALFHVAALVDSGIRSQRIQAWGRHHDWNAVIELLRSLDVGSQRFPDIENGGIPCGTIDSDMALQHEILKRWKGIPEWKPLARTVAQSVAVFRERTAASG